MNIIKNPPMYLSTCLLATAALIGGISSASAQVPLGVCAAEGNLLKNWAFEGCLNPYPRCDRRS